MSAAAVIMRRQRRAMSFLRERGALGPDSAVPEREVPYGDRWYYRRLVAGGAVRRVDGRCYLDEAAATAYVRAQRRRALAFAAIGLVVLLLYLLVAATLGR